MPPSIDRLESYRKRNESFCTRARSSSNVACCAAHVGNTYVAAPKSTQVVESKKVRNLRGGRVMADRCRWLPERTTERCMYGCLDREGEITSRSRQQLAKLMATCTALLHSSDSRENLSGFRRACVSCLCLFVAKACVVHIGTSDRER